MIYYLYVSISMLNLANTDFKSEVISGAFSFIYLNSCKAFFESPIAA